MPELVTYEFKDAFSAPKIEIYDNLNQKVECVFENYTFERTEQTGMDTIPEEFAAQMDALEIAKTWSNFLTRDLEGSKNGFGTVKQLFITDSYC